ncbi:hypothetical protein OA58_02730 [Microcystis aeruginosa NIES-88]|nr:hypothetical protein OA58_02730 [Microcystis aeruginosa NIES-88]
MSNFEKILPKPYPPPDFVKYHFFIDSIDFYLYSRKRVSQRNPFSQCDRLWKIGFGIFVMFDTKLWIICS